MINERNYKQLGIPNPDAQCKISSDISTDTTLRIDMGKTHERKNSGITYIHTIQQQNVTIIIHISLFYCLQITTLTNPYKIHHSGSSFSVAPLQRHLRTHLRQRATVGHDRQGESKTGGGEQRRWREIWSQTT